MIIESLIFIHFLRKQQIIGLSPNGKATDSDSVIFKVRILVAQLVIRVRGIVLFFAYIKFFII